MRALPLLASVLSLAAAFQAPKAHAQSGTQNYNYGVFVTRPLADEVTADMPIEQIAALKTVNDDVKTAIMQAASSTQSSLFKLLMTDPSAPTPAQVNLPAELLKALKQFNRQVLVNLKTIAIPRELEYQIHFAPRLSPILAARRNGEPSTTRHAYPLDRISVIEPMPSVDDMNPDAQSQILSEIYPGIAIRLVDGYTRQPENPFFVALSLKLKLRPKVETSVLTAQIILGTPVNRSMPFTEGNEQIQFKTVEFPKFNPRSLGIGAEDLPAAMITIEQPMNNLDGSMYMEFGPINGFKDGRWVRTGQSSDYRDLAPKLIGTPNGIAKNKIDVAFNVLNLTADIESRGLSELDLFISVGVSGMPGLRMAWINKADIDNQFRGEINKAIAKAVVEQEEKLKATGLEKAKLVPGGDSEVVQKLINDLFTFKSLRK